MGMPYKNSVEIAAVWFITGIGNILAQAIGVLDYLPVIKEILGILSILLAIGFTLYKFRKDWSGVNPKKKK